MSKHWSEYRHTEESIKGENLCVKPTLDMLQGKDHFCLEHCNYILWLVGLRPLQLAEASDPTLKDLVWAIIVKKDWHKNGLPEE